MEDVNLTMSSICDGIYNPNVDYVYIPKRRLGDSQYLMWDNLLSKSRAIFPLFQCVVRILLLEFCALIFTCLVVLMAQYMFHYQYALMSVSTCQKLYVLIYGSLLLTILFLIKLELNTYITKAGSYHRATVLIEWLIIWISPVTAVPVEALYYPKHLLHQLQVNKLCILGMIFQTQSTQ